jgi:hypothetical protein
VFGFAVCKKNVPKIIAFLGNASETVTTNRKEKLFCIVGSSAILEVKRGGIRVLVSSGL